MLLHQALAASFFSSVVSLTTRKSWHGFAVVVVVVTIVVRLLDAVLKRQVTADPVQPSSSAGVTVHMNCVPFGSGPGCHRLAPSVSVIDLGFSLFSQVKLR